MPLEIVDKNLPKTVDEFLEKPNAYKDALENPISWSKVPLLNYTPLRILHEGKLVRFRGMVQDMMNTEIYMERCEIHNTQEGTQQVRIQHGKYRDSLLLKDNEYVHHDARENVQGDRRPIVVVPIPALNSWANQYEDECNKIVIENELTTQMEVDEVAQKAENNAPSVSKKPKLQESPNDEHLQIAEGSSQVCIVKLYDHLDTYTLNSIIDVLGFLAFDAQDEDDNKNDNDDNICTPTAKEKVAFARVPRLHAIAVHSLPHYNPLLDLHLMASSSVQHFVKAPLTMHATQQELHKFLALCLFNDTLAAEYLLCHLISTIYNHTDLDCIGKFSLNICNLKPSRNNKQLDNKEPIPDIDFTKHLYEVLQLLLPASHYLPMDITTLNATKFLPNKDYESDKILSGMLQLAAHTHLVLDETSMQQGKLEDNGVRGIQALTSLINHQRISCDFQFYKIEYNVNIPVLVLSEGRSMLPHDFIVPIEADAKSVAYVKETLAAAHHYLQTENRLIKFRRFLTMARTAAFEITPTAAELIEQDFEEMRRTYALQKPEELHAHIVLARLSAIAHGKTELDQESWSRAKTLEAQRKRRVEKLPKSKMATATAQALLADNNY